MIIAGISITIDPHAVSENIRLGNLAVMTDFVAR